MTTPQLSITQAQVQYDDNLGEYNLNFPGIFADYLFINHYEQDRHIYMASQTSETPFNGSKVGFVRVGSNTLLWICEWTACQVGAQPQIPDPVPESTGWVLLDVQPSLAGKSLITDGTSPIYRVSGVYIYGHKNPDPDIYKNAVFPLYPWVGNGNDRQMSQSNIIKGMMDLPGGQGNNDGRQLGNTVAVQQG